MASVIGSCYRLCPLTQMSSCSILFLYFTVFNFLVSWYLFRGGECKYILNKEVNKEIGKMKDFLDVFLYVWNQSAFMSFECQVGPHYISLGLQDKQNFSASFIGSFTALYISSIIFPILLNLLPLKSCFPEFHFCKCMVLFQNLLRT